MNSQDVAEDKFSFHALVWTDDTSERDYSTWAEQLGNNVAAKMELSLLNWNLSGIFSTCYRD